jgi:serine/threonine protein kinase
MGVVWSATARTNPASAYAIKVIDKSKLVDAKSTKRVIAERDIMASLKPHPFIVKLHFAFQDGSRLFFVMDCLKTDLYKMVQGMPGRRVPVDSMRLYLSELIQALEFLHDQNIIFMDVKLENLLVSERGHVQLADFGLARHSNSKQRSTLLGTPSYFSPEIILGTTSFNRTMDVWACGIIAYELLCGIHPFDDSGSAKNLFNSIMEDPIHFPEGVRADNDGINVIVKRFIQGLLIKEPSARLGGSDWKEVKAHPFFGPLNWNHVYDLAYDPVLKPPVNSAPTVPNMACQNTALGRLSRDFKSFVSGTSPLSSPSSSAPPSPYSSPSSPYSSLASRRKLSKQCITDTSTSVTALKTQLSRRKFKQCTPLTKHLTRYFVDVDSEERSPSNGAWNESSSPPNGLNLTVPLAAISNSSRKMDPPDSQTQLDSRRRLYNAIAAHRTAISKETLSNFHFEEATKNAEQMYRTLEIIPACCAFAKLSLSSRKFLWCCPSFVSMMGGARVVDMGPSNFCLESDWKRLEDFLSKASVECEFSGSMVLTLKPPLENCMVTPFVVKAPFVVKVTAKRRSTGGFKGVLLWRQYRFPAEKAG